VMLVEGEVRMDNNSVLEQEDLDEGWRLACQSHPVTDVVKVTYS
jgi:3-ketosteroid 9alpha-monooxygenase subunit B